MSVRHFDGVDDRITCALGSLGFAFGPGTIACILRLSDDSGTKTAVHVGTSAGPARYTLYLSGQQSTLQCGINTAVVPAGFTIGVVDDWVLIAVTKATGTVAPRFHRYKFATGVWQHGDAGASIANSGAATTASYLGGHPSGLFYFDGDIGIGGVANVVLSDSQIEELVVEEAAWAAAGLDAVWPLTQASTSTAVQDTVGGADETTLVGTSITSVDIPWTGVPVTFDLTPATTLDEAQPLDYSVDTPIEVSLTPAMTSDEAQPLDYFLPIEVSLTPATTSDEAQPLDYLVYHVRDAVTGDPRPSLALYGEIESRDGRVQRLDPEHRDAANRSIGIAFSTRLMEGFTTGTCSVRRDIRRHWSDLRLNGTLRFVGEAARVAYEGRLARFPANNEDGHTIGLEAVGWMTHARDRARTFDPAGLTCDQAIKAIAAFCPLLNTEGVLPSSRLVTHPAWDDLTDPLDMWLELNAAELRQLAVWTDRRLVWVPLARDEANADWVVRLDEGASVNFDGPSTARLATGVQVQYDDVDTSLRTVLTPDTTPSLTVNDPDLLDALGEQRIVPTIKLARPNTAAGAVHIGVTVLADLNRPKNPCRLTVKGHVRDLAGNWQQGWLPRAGETVVIEDYDDSPPRLIHETSWTQDTLTMVMDLDANGQTIDSLIANAGGGGG